MYLSNTNVHALRLFARVMKVGRGADPGLYKIWIPLQQTWPMPAEEDLKREYGGVKEGHQWY